MCKKNNDARTRASKGEIQYQGMNWIRQEKRLAIYLRDGLACCYCGASVEEGTKLSLDHVIPHSKNGTNHETNLVTCCCKCNSSRSDRELETFCKAVSDYVNHGVTSEQILEHVKECTERPLKQYKEEAKALVARRGSVAKVLAQYQE